MIVAISKNIIFYALQEILDKMAFTPLKEKSHMLSTVFLKLRK